MDFKRLFYNFAPHMVLPFKPILPIYRLPDCAALTDRANFRGKPEGREGAATRIVRNVKTAIA